MKFFIPKVNDQELAEKTYQSIVQFAKGKLLWDIAERRIFHISYNYKGKRHETQIGQINDTNREEVIAILESNAYLICTPTRGVLQGMPILVGAEEVICVNDFEP
ncbi:hypothetical protein ACFLU7_00520 [Chloroflexota bacterium]